jgi:hypothetical protein
MLRYVGDTRGVEKMRHKPLLFAIFYTMVLIIGINISCSPQTSRIEPLSETDEELLSHLDPESSDYPNNHIHGILIREFTTYISFLGIDYTDDQLVESKWREFIPFELDYPNFIIVDSSNMDKLEGKYSFICEKEGDTILMHRIGGLKDVVTNSFSNKLYNAWESNHFDTELLFILRCLIDTSVTHFQDICDVYDIGLDAMKFNSANKSEEYYDFRQQAKDLLENHNFVCNDESITWEMSHNSEAFTYTIPDIFISMISPDLLRDFNENVFIERMDEAKQ